MIARARPRRIVDLCLTEWWDGSEGVGTATRSLVAAPIDLPDGAPGAVAALSETRDRFAPADLTLLTRLGTLASQALATQALAERNAFLAQVIDGASASVAIADAADPDLPLIYVNRAFLELSGYDRSEVIGQNCRFLTAEPPDSPERVRLREAVAARAGGEFVLRNQRRDGSRFWNRLSLYSIAGPDGAPRFLVATQVDITAERAAEAERDMARRRLIGALSSAAEGFLLLDGYGRIVFANPQFRNFYESERALWHPGDDFVATWAIWLVDSGMAKGVATRRARARRAALFSGGRDREETLPDGRVLLVNDHPTADGGAVSIATDITSLKATERVLAQRAVAMDSAQDGIAVTDGDGRFVYLNPSHVTMFGYARASELLGRPWSVLYTAEEAEMLKQVAMSEVKRTGTWRGEVQGIAKDGRTVPQEVSLNYRRGVGIVCVTRDISERRRGERERMRLREQLHAAQRQEAVGQLAAGVAHDFNNLLSAIAGSAALLQLDLGPEHPGRVHAERIVQAGARAAELVNRLLALGARKSERARIDLRAPFAEAAELLRAGVSGRFTLIAEPTPDPVFAEADATDVLQVLLNLAINARDAMPPEGGSITLDLVPPAPIAAPPALRIGRIAEGEPYAVLRVTDTGTGIDPADLENIFRPYYSTKGDDGTGLGLAVVASIVRAANGAVAVETEAGRGTRFTVFWPAEAPPEAPAAVSPAGPGDRLAGHTILICDDDEAVAHVLAAIAEQAGAEAALCADPRDALDAVREDPEAWDLLVTDYDMPQISGAELARAARAVRPGLPVLLCTALAQHHRPQAPFDAVLAKPVEPAQFISAAMTAMMRTKAAETDNL